MISRPIVFLCFLVLYQVAAGPVAYGACQSACAGLVVACYSAAGVTFGTITAGAGTPAIVLGCNSAFGVCSAKCAAFALLAPIP